MVHAPDGVSGDRPEALRAEVARLTERLARVEQQANETDELYRALVESTDDGVWVIDPDGRTSFVNQKLAGMLGRTSAEIVGRHALEVVQERDAKDVLARLVHLEPGAVTHSDPVVLHTDGGAVRARIVSRPLVANGRRLGTLALVTDISEQTRSEDELRANQAPIEGLVASAMDAIIAVDADQTIVLFNPAAEQVFRCSAAEAIGSSLDRFMPERHRAAHRGHVAGFAGTGATNRRMGALGTLSALRADGDEFPIEASISHTTVGGQEMLTVILRDITERKRAEQALRASEAQLETVIENLTEGLVVSALDGRLLHWNRAAREMHGLTSLEEGRRLLPEFTSIYELLTLDGSILPFDQWPLVQILRGDSIANLQLRIRRLGTDWERVFAYGGTLVYDDQGNPTMAIVTIADITDAKRAELALRDTNERLQALIDASPLAIVLLDEQRIVREWNRAAERLFGWKREEIIGRPYPLVPEQKRDEHQANWQALREGRGMAGVETHREAKDGKLRDVVLYTAPVRDSSGNFRYGMVILADNGERRDLQQQLLQSQKMEAIGRLAGGVAHDFNNLLTAIIGYSELATSIAGEDAALAGYLRSVETAATRAAELTRQLLAFARRQIIEPRVLNINETILDADKLLRRLIGEDIELVTIPRRDLGMVRADPGQIEQVVLNLAVNARDAMPDGGRLTIETDNVSLGEEYARHHAEVTPGEYVLLAITDNGVGMTDEVKAHVFEPFFTTKEVGRGTGLGLATCFGIVKQSGGHIWYYSEVGHGTTIKVYLPRVWEEVPHRRGEEIETTPGGHETVLVVEDEPLVRDMTVEVLRSLGYNVVEARTGAEAVEVSNSHAGAIDLLITDVVMPHYSGRQIAEELLRRRDGLRVLYISGYTHNSIVHRGVLDEGISFLSKPFTPAVLARKVRAMLDAHDA